MKSISILTIVLLGAAAVLCQNPAPAPRTGPGTKASQDSREPDLLKTCKNPPAARGGGRPGGGAGGGKGRGPGPAAAAGPKEYAVTEIPGVIAAGQKWKEIWT